jgi:hypothetical protein
MFFFLFIHRLLDPICSTTAICRVLSSTTTVDPSFSINITLILDGTYVYLDLDKQVICFLYRIVRWFIGPYCTTIISNSTIVSDATE